MKYKSLNVKIALIFVALGFFLLIVLFVLIVPKMEKEKTEHTKQQIDNIIMLTTQQLKLTTKFIHVYGENRRDSIKSLLENKMENIQHRLLNIEDKNKYTYINDVSKQLKCDLSILDKNKEIVFSTSNNRFNTKYITEQKWHIVKSDKQTVCPTSAAQIIYSLKSNIKDESLVLACNPRNFEDPMNFEFNLKKDVQDSFALTNDIHKGKIYLMWLDEKKLKGSKQPLYNTNDDRYYNNKYCVSRISNMDFPKTGLLTGTEIIEAIDKDPIRHFLDKDKEKGKFIYPALTWVRSLNHSENNVKLLFITTVLEEDYHNKIDSSFWKILPASLIALFTAILVGLLVFRKIFNTITILGDTARKVIEGNINIRSNIRGKDDIGVLGTTFDSMLDTIEKNIHDLDKTVETRTYELQSSLDEKEILLREIHHRVKNNLAMTIELIKIQKIKLKDNITKTALGDIQERIYVMELLHRKLYESKNLSSIDIRKYIKDLVVDISNGYDEDNNIQIDIDIEESYFMDIEYALPCGLIINECLTNSLKHAFDLKHGKISISLIKEEEYFILKIKDNGKGIDKKINIKTTKTLGLRLISSIVRGQLLGTIEYLSDNGASFIIRFKP